MVAYLIIPRLYLAQEVAHGTNFSNGCSSSSLRYSSLPKLFDLFLLIPLAPSFPFSLSFFLSLSILILLRLPSSGHLESSHSPIRTDSSIIRFITFLRNSCRKISHLFHTSRSTLVTIVMHIVNIRRRHR